MRPPWGGRCLKELKVYGILLNVDTKNEEENALAGLNHPEGALRPDDFIMRQGQRRAEQAPLAWRKMT